jgi:hypothetical protein
MENQRIITATVPRELLELAHQRAALEDRSTASIVRRALNLYLRPASPDAVAEETRTKG